MMTLQRLPRSRTVKAAAALVGLAGCCTLAALGSARATWWVLDGPR